MLGEVKKTEDSLSYKEKREARENDDYLYIKELDLDITEAEKKEIKHLNVLYLDDDSDVLDSYSSMHRFDFNIFTTTDPMEARHIIATKDIQIIITDQRMPYMTGLEFFTMISQEHPEPIRILLTGYANLNAVVDAVKSRIIFRHVSKPFTPNMMRQAIKSAAEMYYLQREIRER